MVKDIHEYENYDPPYADEANKGWKHLVEYCLDQYVVSNKSKYRDKKLQEIKDAVDVYNQDESPSSDMWEGEANYTVPLTVISCDNLEPRLVSGLVGKKPYVAFEMDNDQPKDEPTEILETWFNQELEETCMIEKASRTLIHRILQEGTVYPLPSYDFDEQLRSDFVFQDDIAEFVKKEPEKAKEIAQKVEEGSYVWETGILMDLETAEPVMIDVQDSIFEGGKIGFVPFHDVYIADDVDDWEKACVIRKVYPTYSQLMVEAKEKLGYKNIGPWLYGEADEGQLSKDNVSASQEYDQIREHGKKTIECIECSLSYIYRDDDTEEKDNTNMVEERVIAQIALESKILIRLIPLRKIYHKNEHLLKRVRMFPEEGKSYGTSMAAKLKSIQKGASKTFNMALNIAEITMIPWFLFTEASGLKGRYPNGLSLKPGAGVQVDDVSQLYFPKFAINPDQMFNWINLWVGFWERVSSIGDLQIGRQSDKDRTATETMAVIQEGNIKHNYQSTSIKEDFLGVIRTLYDLYYQHMPFNKTFKWNKKDLPIPRSLMRRRKNFKLTGSTEQSNKLIERQEKEQFYNMTGADPNINPIKRAEEFVKSYGYTETEEWVNPNIAGLVEAIMSTPGADQAVQQLLQGMQKEAEQQAKAQEQNEKEGPEIPKDDEKHKQEMGHKEDDHRQELIHNEETHDQAMAHAREKAGQEAAAAKAKPKKETK